MEKAARRFAQWVLLIHFILLAGVVVVVFFASREVYYSARRQAVARKAEGQKLLAEQTARGIVSYYNSVFDTLELLRRSQDDDPPGANLPAPVRRAAVSVARDMMAPALFRQLRNRASHLLLLDRSQQIPPLVMPEGEEDVIRKITQQAGPWLLNLRLASISAPVDIDGEKSNLVALPARRNAAAIVVAVVPIRNINEQFLEAVHVNPQMSAMLLDENMRVLVALDPKLVGKSFLDDGSDPRIGQLARGYLRRGTADTVIVEEPFTIGEHQFASGIFSVEPVELFGKRWWLSIGSDLGEVQMIVQSTLGRVYWWAGGVMLLMTGILVSTAVQLIRGRLRLERAQHEMLTRELDQARKIQIAWLPRNDSDPRHMDLCAVNRPASHISGDFYNWFDLSDGRVCVVIGDVTGHGTAAAFLMATTQLLVRMIMPRSSDPGQCLIEVNRQLCQQVFAGQFVTMQILVIDADHSGGEVANAGHPRPLVSEDEHFEPLRINAELVLGIDPMVKYISQRFELPAGANLVLYTDGVTDAQRPDGERLYIEGLISALRGSYPNAQAIVHRVEQAVDEFRAGRELADDLTLVTLQLQPAKVPDGSMASVI